MSEDEEFLPPHPDGPTDVAARWLTALVGGDDDTAWSLMHPGFQTRALMETEEQQGDADPHSVLDVLRESYEVTDIKSWNVLSPTDVTGQRAKVTFVKSPVGLLDEGDQVWVLPFYVDHTDEGWKVWGRT